jgi:DNA ligase-1
MTTIRPLLACTLENVELLRFPVIVSAKLDGIRCVIERGVAISRNGKPIRNLHVQAQLNKPEYNGLDGELIVGPPSGDGVFNRTTSGIMSIEGKPDFTYWVFDNHLNQMQPFVQRVASLQDYRLPAYIKRLPQLTITSLLELEAFEKQVLDTGYEGVMIRKLDGPYKQGRSTLNEQILLRVKRFRDGEARVVDIEEGRINGNEAKLDNLGYTERSTKQENMLPGARVGTLICEDLVTGQRLRISPGRMNHEERHRYWAFPDSILQRTIKYKVFDYGSIDAPRFATFQGFV